LLEATDDNRFWQSKAQTLDAKCGPTEARRQLFGMNDFPEFTPSVTAYFGILLAAAGQNDNATEYFALAERQSYCPKKKSWSPRRRRHWPGSSSRRQLGLRNDCDS
jgi:hypothetical protein